MKTVIFALLLSFSLTVFGQKSDTLNHNNDTLKNETSNPIRELLNRPTGINTRLRNYLGAEEPVLPEYRVSDFSPSLKLSERKKDTLTTQLPPLDIYYFPSINTNPVNTYYPYANDYNLSAGYRISDQAFITTHSSNISYPTLGRTRTVDAQLGYQPADWLAISGGPYVSKYSVYSNHYDDFGFNGALKLKATENIRFNVYGQYSRYAERNRIGGPLSQMYEQSYYGGTIEFKFSDSFGIEAGMIRELNPLNGKWENKPIISPVFYQTKRKKK